MRIFGDELSTKRSGYPQLCGGYPQFGRGHLNGVSNWQLIWRVFIEHKTQACLYGSVPILSKAARGFGPKCGTDPIPGPLLYKDGPE